jgi:hypothetical protein
MVASAPIVALRSKLAAAATTRTTSARLLVGIATAPAFLKRAITIKLLRFEGNPFAFVVFLTLGAQVVVD